MVPGPFQGLGMLRWVCRGWGYVQGVDMMSGGEYIWGMGTHPLLLTPSGGHHMYFQQAGSAHSTGMHSCLLCFFKHYLQSFHKHSPGCQWRVDPTSGRVTF